MSTAVVWVLVAMVWSAQGLTPIVIDNISSRENCQALSDQIQVGRTVEGSGRCIAVRKVFPAPIPPKGDSQ